MSAASRFGSGKRRPQTEEDKQNQHQTSSRSPARGSRHPARRKQDNGPKGGSLSTQPVESTDSGETAQPGEACFCGQTTGAVCLYSQVQVALRLDARVGLALDPQRRVPVRLYAQVRLPSDWSPGISGCRSRQSVVNGVGVVAVEAVVARVAVERAVKLFAQKSACSCARGVPGSGRRGAGEAPGPRPPVLREAARLLSELEPRRRASLVSRGRGSVGA